MNKILNNKLFVLLLILPFLEPRGVGEMAVYIGGAWTLVDGVFDILRFISFIFIVVVSLSSLRRLSPMLLLCTLYEAIIVFSSILNQNFAFSQLINVVKIIGVCFLIEFYIKTERSAVLFDIMSKILEIFILINFLTLILYPDGMYINNRGWRSNYFFGYKNLHIYVYFIYFVVKSFDNYIKRGNHGYVFGITDIIIFLSSVMCNSSTTLVAISVYYLLVWIFAKRKVPGVVNITTSYFLSFALSLIIILVGAQKYFSLLIVGVLGKNLTFTNRTKIWAVALKSIKESPLIGNGAISYDNIFSTWTVTHAHNQFLDILLMGGILLLVVFTAMVILANNRFGMIKNLKEYNIIQNKILFIWIGYFIMFLMEARRDDVYMFMLFIITYHLVDVLGTVKTVSAPKRKLVIRFGRRLSE